MSKVLADVPTVTKEQVVQLNVDPKTVLLNVLTPEVFTQCHIPGSVNACVYEVAFPEHIAKLGIPKDSVIIAYGMGVCGGGHASHEATLATERLHLLGYTKAVSYPGGLHDWKCSEYKLKGELPKDPELKDIKAGAFQLDIKDSVIHWTGRNLLNKHWGTLSLTKGAVELKDGKIHDAGCTIDMNSLIDKDIADPHWNSVLVAHLKSDDFFAVDKFPEAKVALVSATPVDAKCGDVNYRFVVNLTLRGFTHEVEFGGMVVLMSPTRLLIQAQLEFDRTRWGILYGSKAYFAKLEGHFVSDKIALELKLLYNISE